MLIVFIPILLLGLSLFFNRLTFRAWDSPWSLYSFAWGLMVCLFLLGWVDFIPIQHSTWFALMLSYGAFLLGCCAALPARLSVPKEPIRFSEKKFLRLLLICSLLGLVGLVLQMIHLERTMGLRLLLDDPAKARNLHTYVPVFGYFNLLNVCNPALMVLFWSLFKKFPKWFWCSIAIALLSALISTDRTRLFYTVLWAVFVLVHRVGRSFSWRNWFALAGVGFALIFFFLLIGDHFKRTYAQRWADVIHLPSSVQALTDPYIYLTGNIPAFQELMDRAPDPYLGKSTFLPFFEVLKPVLKVEDLPSLQGELYGVPMEFNTYSYLQQFYLDFHWWGLFLGPFWCGLVVSWVFLKMKQRPDFLYLYWASLFSFCVLISIFVNFFSQQATWFFLLLGPLFNWAIREAGRAINS
ncbi:MAG: oligosaccharide repeat unit polymerase [Acidobacteria bacterium]|nr:oligosaccharide repeat unit polymerase [Acidobacteriota bacterium]